MTKADLPAFTVWAALAALAFQGSAAHAAPIIGRVAPPLVGQTLTGQRFNLAALRGRVVVVNLWATWCGPCREEMPALDAFSRQYAPRGVVVVGLSEDKPQALPMAERIMDGLAYPALPAATAQADGFGMPPSLPVTVIIGPDGVVRTIFSGVNGLLTEETLAALVEPLLPVKPRPL
jgi:cytochrome c biogenesis protein CcmG/thiol:disulfide interchange protein DsbE